MITKEKEELDFFFQIFSGGWRGAAGVAKKKEEKKKLSALATSEMLSTEMHLMIIKQIQ